ncbi:permease [Aromatoleum diolicum]|uniref:Permease n=1 Tax=Aromatoleum diolicum TaxID=75796 RepID=A0ABX1QF09_9RHOO|nr:permease [Aromatoleum diolicum]NMG76528.1 permease [Aromatoleum diolicum]
MTLFIVALVTALAGCANGRTVAADLPPLVSSHSGTAQTVRAALAYHLSIRGMSASELARERPTQTVGSVSPLGQIKQAMLLSHPQGSNSLPRALSLLDAINNSDKPEAVTLHPLARLLADQLQERQRLENTADRLTQQLERTGQQLKDSQKQGEQLQEKLNALAEIERTLPIRPAAPAAPLQTPAERRTTR